jgi:hypothetical protein
MSVYLRTNLGRMTIHRIRIVCGGVHAFPLGIAERIPVIVVVKSLPSMSGALIKFTLHMADGSYIIEDWVDGTPRDSHPDSS